MIILIIMIVSCKKNNNIPSELIGTWQEQSPCVMGSGSCYQFQLLSNDTYNESSPATITGTYTLTDNNAKITFTGGIGAGTYHFQLMGTTELIIDSFYTPISAGLQIVPRQNVTLLKIN